VAGDNGAVVFPGLGGAGGVGTGLDGGDGGQGHVGGGGGGSGAFGDDAFACAGGGGGGGSNFADPTATGPAFEAGVRVGNGLLTLSYAAITAITIDANSVVVTGSGFPANTVVTVDIQSTPLVLGTLTADANGAFSKTFTIPCSVGSGSHTVTATAATGQKASTGVTLAACPVVAAIKFTG
jgi:hypothetical protein